MAMPENLEYQRLPVELLPRLIQRTAASLVTHGHDDGPSGMRSSETENGVPNRVSDTVRTAKPIGFTP
jgi:hypothetical protein